VKCWFVALVVFMTLGLLVAGCGSTDAAPLSSEDTSLTMSSSTPPVAQPTTTASTLATTTTASTLATTTTRQAPTTQSTGEDDGHFKASGSLTRTDHTSEMTQGTGTLILKGVSEFDIHGTIEGTGRNQFTMEIDQTTGKISFNADLTVSGSVDGKQGTYQAKEVGTGQMYSQDAGKISGQTTILSGTGELANLQGTMNWDLTFDAQGLGGTYSGDLYFTE
jgi:Protein of unknown function (DUF3224)